MSKDDFVVSLPCSCRYDYKRPGIGHGEVRIEPCQEHLRNPMDKHAEQNAVMSALVEAGVEVQ